MIILGRAQISTQSIGQGEQAQREGFFKVLASGEVLIVLAFLMYCVLVVIIIGSNASVLSRTVGRTAVKLGQV